MMERHEIEKKLTEMVEDLLKFYHANVPNGGKLSIVDVPTENGTNVMVYNEATYHEEFDGNIDFKISPDGSVYSIGHDGEYEETIRTKEGEWIV